MGGSRAYISGGLGWVTELARLMWLFKVEVMSVVASRIIVWVGVLLYVYSLR